MNKLSRHKLITIIIAALAITTPSVNAGKFLESHYIYNAPRVDGIASDKSWISAIPVSIKDGASDTIITLKSVYTHHSLYFLVTYPDPDESRSHRPWVWNETSSAYEVGPDREDCMVFKWFMGTSPKNIHLDSGEPHTADTWFWKANRTDPVGYADDKIQRLAHQKLKRALKLNSSSGRILYLQRQGDSGQAAYADKIVVDYMGKIIPRFNHQNPSGSRADIRAKGIWKDGYWVIEFSRKLDTGNSDDIQFETTKSYLFGVSRYEVAGREPDYNTTQPLYGAGRLSEHLYLRFSPQP